jgi:serine/threonine-protein kinase
LPARLGRYELQQILGKGGMGVVYLAFDAQLGRRVALKIPYLFGPDADAVRELRTRFLREARLAATLTHPNLCPVHDFGEIDGVLYLAMAYLEGKPLATFIRPEQQLPPRAVVAVVRQLARAMAAAHDKGIIHRDLKPANIMITPQRQPVIMDFGLARQTAEEDTKLTREGRLLGTPAYMAPEQFDSDARRIGPACDIYALGVILYELLAGRTPFQGSLNPLIAQVLLDPPPPLSRWRGDLNPQLEDLCARALAKNPDDRFPTMLAFAAALESYLRVPAREAAAAPQLVPAPKPTEPRPAPRRKRGPPPPLDEENAATLFNEMARQQAHDDGSSRGAAPVRRRRRAARHWPEWLVPAAIGVVMLVVMGLVLTVLVGLPPVQPSPQPSQPEPEAPSVGGLGTIAPFVKSLTQPSIEETQPSIEELYAALDKLKGNPNHPESQKTVRYWARRVNDGKAKLSPDLCLKVGKYLILVLDDWGSGRPLVCGSDPRWAEVIELESKARQATIWREEVRCGDLWWDLAETESDWPPANRLRELARYWYERALKDYIDPNDRERARKRIKQVGP